MTNNPSTADDTTPDPAGVLGRDVSLRPQGRADTKLIERALKEHWPIPDALRPALVHRLARIVVDPKVGPREVTSASRAILEASRVNLQGVAVAITAQAATDFDERLRALEQAGPGSETEQQRPRIIIPERDRRHARNRKDHADEEPGSTPGSAGGSPPPETAAKDQDPDRLGTTGTEDEGRRP